jgi:hypothetical protein
MRRVLLLLLGAGIAFAAPSHGFESHNRLAANRLAANRLAANRLAANRLAANSLTSTKLSALQETADMLRTKSGRQVYAYLMSCALNSDTTIVKTGVHDCVDANDDGVPDDTDNNGVPDDCTALANDPTPTQQFDDPQFCIDGTCTFEGNVGLAPDWATRRLSSAGQGWVSACMLARINAFDTAEGISLRGSHPSLSPSSSELGTYTLEEGSFYGNIFGGSAIDWNACQGADQYAWLNGGAPGDGVEDPGDNLGGSLFTRDCAEQSVTNPGTTVCGFRYTGLCGNFADTDYSCKSQDPVNGFYSTCHESDGPGQWGGQTTYRQVITVYVAPP